jgi:two-component SAPR family response regulator
MTALIVDNNVAVLQSVGQMVGMLGHEVRTATTPVEAIRLFRECSPVDFVLIDVILGDDESGFKLADALTAIDAGAPVLMISGYQESYLSDYRQSNRSYPVLRKPFTRKQLSAALERMSVRG